MVVLTELTGTRGAQTSCLLQCSWPRSSRQAACAPYFLIRLGAFSLTDSVTSLRKILTSTSVSFLM